MANEPLRMIQPTFTFEEARCMLNVFTLGCAVIAFNEIDIPIEKETYSWAVEAMHALGRDGYTVMQNRLTRLIQATWPEVGFVTRGAPPETP